MPSLWRELPAVLRRQHRGGEQRRQSHAWRRDAFGGAFEATVGLRQFGFDLGPSWGHPGTILMCRCLVEQSDSLLGPEVAQNKHSKDGKMKIAMLTSTLCWCHSMSVSSTDSLCICRTYCMYECMSVSTVCMCVCDLFQGIYAVLGPLGIPDIVPTCILLQTILVNNGKSVSVNHPKGGYLLNSW